MKTTLLEAYAMLVCLLTVLCLTIALGVGLFDLAQVLVPDVTVLPSGDITSERREAPRSLVMSLSVMSANLMVFVPHWFLGKRAREARTA